MVRLVARKAFSHRGKSYRRGEVVDVSAIESIALRARGQAEKPKAVKVDADAGDDKTGETKTARRRYHRRDLEASTE